MNFEIDKKGNNMVEFYSNKVILSGGGGQNYLQSLNLT